MTAHTPGPSDADVYAFADDHDCSTLEARAILRAEAAALATGEPVDYYAVDRRDLIAALAEAGVQS